MREAHDVAIGMLWSFCTLAIGMCWGFVLGMFLEKWVNSTVARWIENLKAKSKAGAA